ncbi:Glutamate-1-semialdehyde 2,1-aminomutase [Candidatus Magnetaquicoccaceae bacterium FCR-1]|uniref:Glutamate-1-semialdehyde 2,1-aminomutase n=1 Tax=Candidatus Magnetaquiglobus chichijimensis TaxID=3141448 RepID=A0ABQ0CC74_9PROT
MSRSEELFLKAKTMIPGGVNSPVRAFKSVGGTPPFIRSGQGAHITDVDGKVYIDYVGSWGPLIVGHTHPHVVEAICRAAENGCSFGAPTEAEITLAERIIERFPGMEMVRLVNSGTEAVMSAIRLARAATGRDVLVKFEGCYHGHADGLLVAAGSGLATFGVPTSPGITRAAARDTLVLPFNDLTAVETLWAERGNEIAAVIVEPVAGNMGCVLPLPGFLEGLRNVCDTHGSLLIFDEVMTGLRVDRGGAQTLYNIRPDLTTLGKIIGGGLPVGAYGGPAKWMEMIAPAGPVYQAGTLSGNPLAVAAGLATLDLLDAPGAYATLAAKTRYLVKGLDQVMCANNIPCLINHVGSMFGLFFTSAQTVANFTDVSNGDINRFNLWFHGMLQEGIYLAPSAFEAGFVSLAHEETMLDQTLTMAERVAGQLRAA